MPQVAVIHRDDWDGFAGFWVCRQYFEKRGQQYRVQSLAQSPGRPFPMSMPAEYDTVIVLNLEFDAMTLAELDRVTHLIVCYPDRKYVSAPYCFSAEQKCSAKVAWELLFTGPAPLLVEYLEDAEFGRLALADSVAINTAIRSYRPNTIVCQMLEDKLQTVEQRRSLVQQGQAIARAQQLYIEQAQQAAVPVIISGREGLGVNRAAFIDEIAAGICRPKSYALVYYRGRTGWHYHLRSTPAGIDVLEIAEPLGGIGLPQRARFTALHPPQLASKSPFEQPEPTKRIRK